jgi:fucose permease
LNNKVNRFYLVSNNTFSLISISLVKFLFGFYGIAIGPLILAIGKELNVEIRDLSIIFIVGSLGQAVVVYYASLIANKLGKKVVHILFVTLLAIAALIFSLTNTYNIFLLLFFFMGILGISINIIADASIADTFRINRSFYLNIGYAVFGLGSVISPIVFNYIYLGTGDFRKIYLVLFYLSLFVLVLVLLAKYPQLYDEPVKIRPVIKLFKNWDFILIMIFAALSWGTFNAISGWMPTLFNKYLNMPISFSNFSLSFFWMSVLLGRIITTFLSRKINTMVLIRTINIITFFALSLSYFLKDPIFLLVDYLLLGLLLGTYPPLLISYSSNIDKRCRITRLAMIYSVGIIGVMAIPYITGFFGNYYPLNKTIALFSVFFLAYIFIFPRRSTQIKNRSKP